MESDRFDLGKWFLRQLDRQFERELMLWYDALDRRISCGSPTEIIIRALQL